MKEGWKVQTLGTICDFQNGFAFKSNSFCETGVGVVRISDIQNGEVSTEKMTYVDPHKINDDLSNFMVRPNDILIAMSGGTTGKLGINKTGKEFFLNQRVGLFREHKDKLNHLYLFYFLQTKTEESLRIAAGAAQPNLSTSQIKGFEIPVPSLTEQERIVKKLDEAFAKIDGLKQNAEKGLQAVKDLWQATLTKELQHRDGWQKTTIGEICEIVRGKRFVRADIVEEGVPCIHYGDMYTYYGMSATKAKGCVSPELAKKLRFANKNDVVVVAAGENKYDIGVGLAWFGEEPAVVHDACFILKHAQNPMFLSYYFRSTAYHQYLKDEVNEGKICSFLAKPLAEAKISLPPLTEQKDWTLCGVKLMNLLPIIKILSRVSTLSNKLFCERHSVGNYKIEENGKQNIQHIL